MHGWQECKNKKARRLISMAENKSLDKPYEYAGHAGHAGLVGHAVGPNPFKYLAGEALKAIQSNIVADPKDPTYQFSRKVAKSFMRAPQNELEETVNEGVVLVFYNVLETLVKRFYRK
jgi:hypothetical protein